MAQYCMISTKPGDAEVFVCGADQKWESIWAPKKTSRVQFCSSGGVFSFTVLADEDRNEKEYKITHGLTVVANGPNSVQVTVPSATRSMIFLVKFKSVSSAEEFLMKVNNQPVLQRLQEYANPKRPLSGPHAAGNGQPDAFSQSWPLQDEQSVFFQGGNMAPRQGAGYDGPQRAGYDGPQRAGFDGLQRAGFDGLQRAGYDGPQRAGYDGSPRAGYGVLPRGIDDPLPKAGYDGPQRAGYDGPQRAGFDGLQRAGFDGPQRAGFDGPQRAGFDASPKMAFVDSPRLQQPGDRNTLETLSSQLTEAINAGDIKRAKQLLNILLTFDKGPGKFQALCMLPTPEKITYMSITVLIEFQKTKQPLKVYFDIDENASFSDLQLIVEEHLRIPCPTQNWIVGDKLVTTGNLMKKLCDYGIKKDSKEPPLYLYVVHPKKANLSREDLMRVGITRATTAHSSQGPGNQGYNLDIERRPHPPDNFGLPQGAGGALRGADSTIFLPVFQQHGIPLGAFFPPPGNVQAPLPPPPPPKPVGWECPMCTYINKPQRPGCEQCAAPRPEDYKVPNDAPFDGPGRNEEILLVQFLEQEKQEQLKQRDQNYAALMKADDTPLNTNAVDFDCMICYATVQAGEGVILRDCLHEFCKDCLRDCINHSQEAEVKCPYKDDEFACGSVIEEREIRALLTPQELDNWHDRVLRIAENGAGDHSFHCRTPNCKGFCFYDDDVNEFTCQVCNKKNCILCKAIHDGMNCQEYQDDLKRRAVNDAAAKATQDMLEGMIKNGEAMNCPSCKIVVMKKDGCDWIRCSMCKTEICWATKGPRWGPKGNGDSTAGCMCRVGGKKCSPMCRNCH